MVGPPLPAVWGIGGGGPMRLDSLPEPDGNENGGGAAWVVILAVVVVAGMMAAG